MPDTPVTLDTVESFIEERRAGVQFPVWLERRYELDTRLRRVQRLRAATPTLVIVYNLFLLPDWILVGDKTLIALILHLAVVTPWILLTRQLTKDDSSKLLREGLAASIPVAIALQILVSYVLTSSPHAAHYQYFVLLVVLFTNTIQRLPFRFALSASIIILTCHALATLVSGHMSGPVALVSVITMTVSAYLTLIGNYHLERDGRRTYLHVLRDQLRHEKVAEAARRDALTELANRHHLKERLTEIWQETDENVSPVAMIMFDVDHFKIFNDRYGHVAGDECLKRVAACLSAALRSDDEMAVRYGGEEMMVLLPKTDACDAIRIAERIRQAIEALAIPHEAAGSGCFVTVSGGVAAAPVSTISSQELIAAADSALYAAKANGRNQVWPLLSRGEDSDWPSVANVAAIK